ncbi:MAG TPA: glutamate synthase subunit beta, partial [Bacteroidales bacterium]
KPKPPLKRTGKTVAVIGSGPAGLAAADQLNKAGHLVVVFEKSDAIGGLLRYGIPDFKMSKVVIDRRLNILEQEGIIFKTGIDAGKDISARELLDSYDALCLTVGAMKPRDLPVEGRDLKGVHFAMEFLTQQNKVTRGEIIPQEERISAKDKNVLIIGGGDTGSDCVGTSIRQGAKRVMQIEILPKPPDIRETDNPWPYYGYTLKTTSSHQEGCERRWSLNTMKFHGNHKVEKAEVASVEWTKNAFSRPGMKLISGSAEMIDADLVLLAMGFVHPEKEGLLNDLQVAYTERNNVQISKKYQTSIPKVFAAGDTVLGASLVVKAIFSGRSAAREINAFLTSEA